MSLISSVRFSLSLVARRSESVDSVIEHLKCCSRFDSDERAMVHVTIWCLWPVLNQRFKCDLNVYHGRKCVGPTKTIKQRSIIFFLTQLERKWGEVPASNGWMEDVKAIGRSKCGYFARWRTKSTVRVCREKSEKKEKKKRRTENLRVAKWWKQHWKPRARQR